MQGVAGENDASYHPGGARASVTRRTTTAASTAATSLPNRRSASVVHASLNLAVAT